MNIILSSTESSDHKNQSLQARNLHELFDSGFRFRIPSYQRAYSWEIKQFRQLIEDLNEHPAGTPYYFGHFLFESGKEADELLIIDGQQRLTTYVILISCIFRALKDKVQNEHINFSEINQRYLINKLETIQDDRPAFEDLIQRGETADRGQSQSKKRLIDAMRFFTRVLRQHSEDTILSWLGILEKAEITTFVVHSKPQAAQIFTLQNSRGKDLTNLEELKAYLMFNIYLNAESKAAEEAITKVENSFAGIYRDIERIKVLSEDSVLTHHDRAYSLHWGKPLENLKRDINTAAERAPRVDCIVCYARDLRYTFQHVAALEHILQNDEVIADPIILDAQNSWPLLIKLYRHYAEALTEDSQLRELLKDVSIILLKLRFQHGNSSNNLIKVAKGFDGTAEKLKRMSEDMRHYTSRGFNWRGDFDQRVQSSLDGDYHYSSTFRFILWKYENWRQRGGDRTVLPCDYMNLGGKHRNMDSTIEHIAPRNGTYEEEFKSKWLNNLGNLLFMPKGINSSLSDKSPLQKAQDLDTSYKSHREVREAILKAQTWGEDQIRSRKADLVKFIQIHWRIPTTEQIK